MSRLAPAVATTVQPRGCLEFGTNQKHVGTARLPADEMPVGIDVQPGWLGETLPCVLKSLLMWIVAVQISSFFPSSYENSERNNKQNRKHTTVMTIRSSGIFIRLKKKKLKLKVKHSGTKIFCCKVCFKRKNWIEEGLNRHEKEKGLESQPCDFFFPTNREDGVIINSWHHQLSEGRTWGRVSWGAMMRQPGDHAWQHGSSQCRSSSSG